MDSGNNQEDNIARDDGENSISTSLISDSVDYSGTIVDIGLGEVRRFLTESNCSSEEYNGMASTENINIETSLPENGNSPGFTQSHSNDGSSDSDGAGGTNEVVDEESDSISEDQYPRFELISRILFMREAYEARNVSSPHITNPTSESPRFLPVGLTLTSRSQRYRQIRDRVRRIRNFIDPTRIDLESDSSSTNDDDDVDVALLRSEGFSFEPTLAASHGYLGKDLEEVRGSVIFDHGEIKRLPLLVLRHVVLTPGCTLPLQIFDPQEMAMFRKVADGDRTFGLVTKVEENVHTEYSSRFGCSATIYCLRVGSDPESWVQGLRFKVVLRQRFELLQVQRDVDGSLSGMVQFRPERNDVLPIARLLHRLVPTVKEDGSWDRSTVYFGSYSPAYMTALPPWVYRMYHVESLIGEVWTEMKNWNMTSDTGENIPGNVDAYLRGCRKEDFSPIVFTNWVTSSLPVSDKERLALLASDCIAYRLRRILSVLRQCSDLVCSTCSQVITSKHQLFSMSSDGVMNPYVNLSGIVFETLTVLNASGLHPVSVPTEEYSWFPGYKWTVMQCSTCSCQIGWKFTAAKPDLTPRRFWGLTRSSLRPVPHNDSSES